MSTPGRKPKPSRVRELQGNPGKRKINKREPKPKTPATRPHGLGRGIRRKFWDEHAEELERLGILTGADTSAFRLMCEHYAVAIKASKELREQGFTVKGRDGFVKKNPLAQVFRDNSVAFRGYAEQFGMTPSARARLEMPMEAEQLSLADLLFQKVNEEIEDPPNNE